jgi:hypothetical protein
MPRHSHLPSVAVVLTALLVGGCESLMPTSNPTPKRDINAVLADHDQRLMAMPGVVGVYVGLLEDGATPCLKVMLRERDPKLEESLPRVLEGYRVVPEVTGEIKPLRAP